MTESWSSSSKCICNYACIMPANFDCFAKIMGVYICKWTQLCLSRVQFSWCKFDIDSTGGRSYSSILFWSEWGCQYINYILATTLTNCSTHAFPCCAGCSRSSLLPTSSNNKRFRFEPPVAASLNTTTWPTALVCFCWTSQVVCFCWNQESAPPWDVNCPSIMSHVQTLLAVQDIYIDIA